MVNTIRVILPPCRVAGLLGLLVLALSSQAASGQNWPRFRGPNGQGVSDATTIPTSWQEDDYNWKVTLAGGGHSSPIVWGRRVFVTSADAEGDTGILQVFNVTDGAFLWQREFALTPYRVNKLNSYATATPTADAGRVYVLWSTSGETILAALSHEGKDVWRRQFPGAKTQHGTGGSPVVVGDKVIFTYEQEVGQGEDLESTWIAVDTATGEDRWRVKRALKRTSYSTPCLLKPANGRAQLIFTSNAHGITGLDPQTGTVLWEMGSAFPQRVVSAPVIAGDMIIGTCGQGGSGTRLVAVKPLLEDGNCAVEQAYDIKGRTAPYVPTSLACDGLLFTFHDGGYVSCLEAATGRQLWREKPAGRYFGSPVCVGGHIYCITVDGDVVVIKASRQYELLAVNRLGEKSHATPALAAGRIFLRTYSHMVCLGGEAP